MGRYMYKQYGYTLIRLRNGYKAEFCNGWYTVNIFCVYDNWRKIVF